MILKIYKGHYFRDIVILSIDFPTSAQSSYLAITGLKNHFHVSITLARAYKA